MAKRTIKAGSVDQTIDVFIMDSTSTTGAGKTGLAFNTSGLKCYYRKGATGTATALTLATQTVGGAHSDGGFVEIDATNMAGIYRLDLSDTIVASSPWVTLYLYGATGMAPVAIELEITGVDLFDGVRMGLTALPNAAAETAGGLYTRGTGAGQINQPANGLIDVNTLRWNGTAVATPATAGIPEVNVKNINNVSAASVTTINANQGTTQPINFTGTGASATVKGDVTAFGGTNGAFSGGRPEVNVSHIKGTPSPAAAGYVGIDWAFITNQGAAGVTLTGTSILSAVTVDTVGTVSGSVGYVSSHVYGNVIGNVNGNVGGSVATVLSLNANCITAASIAADTGVKPVRSNTAQDGASTTITLDASASATNDIYKGLRIVTTGGTGSGQSRIITAYDGTTKVATVASAWVTNPNATTTFAIVPDTAPKTDSNQAVTVGTNSDKTGYSLSSAQTFNLTGNITGNLLGSVGSVTGAVGSVTSAVTLPSIPTNWITSAGIASGALNGKGDWSTTTPPTTSAIATAIWTDTVSGDFTTAGSPGKAIIDNLNATVSSRSTYAGGAVASVTAAVTVGTNNDKTGYSLAASGLDAIAVTDPGAPSGHTSIAKMLVALWRSVFKKKTMTATQAKFYADDGSTINATSALTDDGTTQTWGPMS